MTDKEKAVVMAYTGCVMLEGSRLKVFYDYVSELIGRPVFTHELAILSQRIKEAATTDFIEMCRCDTAENEPVRHGQWIPVDEGSESCDEWQCTACWEIKTFVYEMDYEDMQEFYSYCPNCGARMDGKEQGQ